jgi:hypothetical protein
MDEVLIREGEIVEARAPGLVLTGDALYVSTERIPRRDITGIEFDRGGASKGAMVFLGRRGELARIDVAGLDRAGYAEIERRLAPKPSSGKRAIKVTLNQADYAPGETVRGHVIVDWPKAAQVRGIRVGLVGAEETRITVSTGSGKHRSTHTYRERNTIFGEEIVLWGGRPVSWWKAMGEGVSRLFKTLDYDELPAGRHEYDFDFRLPSRALPTYRGQHATVAYRLYANVDVPCAFDLAFEGAPTVVNARGTRFRERKWSHSEEAKGLLKPFKASVDMKLDVGEVELRAGEKLEGTIQLVNASKKRIRAIDLAIVARENARARHHQRLTDTVLESGRLAVPDPSAERQEARWAIKLPSTACTYNGRHSWVQLWLRASLDVAMGFDVSVEVPLEV